MVEGADITGAGAVEYVYPFGRVPVPSVVVTLTVTAPRLFAGVTQVRVVLETNTTLVAATPPKVAVAPEEKFVPVIETGVPPAGGPKLGVTEMTVGGGGGGFV